jgi:PadR family transcriptional regulator, regulatory protein PadR
VKPEQTTLLQGTLDMLILKSLLAGELHGLRVNRRAKYYRLTKAGRKQLEMETRRWGRISCAISQALEA